MDDTRTFRIASIDWRWIVVTYCFLVLFHLFPSSLVSGLSLFRLQSLILPIFAWLGVGIVAVCAYVGFRSAGMTLAEAGIASMLYVATLFFVLPKGWPPSFYYRVLTTPWLAAFLVVIFLAGLGGAAFGKWLQIRKKRIEWISIPGPSEGFPVPHMSFGRIPALPCFWFAFPRQANTANLWKTPIIFSHPRFNYIVCDKKCSITLIPHYSTTYHSQDHP